MKNIAFVVYRQWAFEIYEAIAAYQAESGGFQLPLLITTPEHEFTLPRSSAAREVLVLEGNDQAGFAQVLAERDIDVACFYGWSWIVREPILSDHTCLCLHPSPLPKYRGGSPIQHQIVAGEDMSAVSVIKMSEGIDDGDLYRQIPFSMAGTLDEILARMVDLGIVITRKFIEDTINESVVFTPQKHLDAHPPLKRRTQADGEITLEKSVDFSQVYNLVRGLTDPYPNAFITLPDGVVYIQSVHFRKEKPTPAQVITKDTPAASLDSDVPIAFAINGGYALIRQYRCERNT